jgi:hypothetical protein
MSSPTKKFLKRNKGVQLEEHMGHTNDYISEAVGTVHSQNDYYHSDSVSDSSSRGGPLGTSNEMPPGGDSTRFPEPPSK